VRRFMRVALGPFGKLRAGTSRKRRAQDDRAFWGISNCRDYSIDSNRNPSIKSAFQAAAVAAIFSSRVAASRAPVWRRTSQAHIVLALSEQET
jgi:hypothetical protein